MANWSDINWDYWWDVVTPHTYRRNIDGTDKPIYRDFCRTIYEELEPISAILQSEYETFIYGMRGEYSRWFLEIKLKEFTKSQDVACVNCAFFPLSTDDAAYRPIIPAIGNTIGPYEYGYNNKWELDICSDDITLPLQSIRMEIEDWTTPEYTDQDLREFFKPFLPENFVVYITHKQVI